MADPLLTVRALALSFGGVHALRGVDLDVPGGAATGLIGPNGAGKTTFFNAITGFIHVDAGSIMFSGRNLSGLPAYRIARLGLVRTFQRTRPLADLTVLENVMAGAYSKGRSGLFGSIIGSRRARREEARTKAFASSVLLRLGLDALADALPTELTAGQHRLLEIARALAGGPRMLLLDEPAAGLNREETAAVSRVISELAESGIGVLLVEHDVEMVFHVCDRVSVLDNGRIVAQGTPAEIRGDPVVIDSYLGHGAGRTAAEGSRA